MAIDFILGIGLARIIAVVLPIVAVGIFYVFNTRFRDRSEGKARKYLSYLVVPPRLHIDGPNKSWRRDKVRLYFYYLAVVLFLASFLIGEFYQVMFDLLLPVTQGSTGDARIVTDVLFTSLFSAGWIGSLPWMGLVTYHETWSWILFTAAFTDNPGFLISVIPTLVGTSIVGGLAFLVPLVIRKIRQSFLSSMFFFTTGMAVFSKATISCLAYACALQFGKVELVYFGITATGDMIPGLVSVIAATFTLALAMFTLFVLLGRKLWMVYYTDSKSKTWFTVFITLSYWLGFVITMMVV
ncbi:MAG: hypothetical protein EAX87_00480 [Candidatus Thorarchaeota archaeon]|nr:hypothetical protein [Candidatus Thorarchaeota archaeon]